MSRRHKSYSFCVYLFFFVLPKKSDRRFIFLMLLKSKMARYQEHASPRSFLLFFCHLHHIVVDISI